MITKGLFIEAVNEGLKDILNPAPEQPIEAAETFTDYGVDSLDKMNLLLYIEEKLKIDLEDLDNDDKLTPDKLYEYISNHGRS